MGCQSWCQDGRNQAEIPQNESQKAQKVRIESLQPPKGDFQSELLGSPEAHPDPELRQPVCADSQPITYTSIRSVASFRPLLLLCTSRRRTVTVELLGFGFSGHACHTAHCVGVVFLSTCPCRLLPTATLNNSTDNGVCSMLCTQGLPLAAERIAGSASRECKPGVQAGSASRGRMASHSDKKQRWCLTLGRYHNHLSPPQHRGGSNASESIEYLGAPPGKRKALLLSSSSSSLQIWLQSPVLDLLSRQQVPAGCLLTVYAIATPGPKSPSPSWTLSLPRMSLI